MAIIRNNSFINVLQPVFALRKFTDVELLETPGTAYKAVLGAHDDQLSSAEKTIYSRRNL
jgi:hypothetical protein